MKALRLVLICALALSFVAIAHPLHAITTQVALSSGCTQLDSLYHPYPYYAYTPFSYMSFYAGETLTVTAAAPGTSLTIDLYIGGAIVDSALFPGTVTYTFPANTDTTVSWRAEGNVTWTSDCVWTGIPVIDEKPPTSSAPIPGCDLGMPISATSVMGRFVADTPAHYVPGTQPDTFVASMKAGQTAWVLGVDASGAYYKIVWDCSLLWVPVSAMGPSYGDALWQGWPLPTQVVE